MIASHSDIENNIIQRWPVVLYKWAFFPHSIDSISFDLYFIRSALLVSGLPQGHKKHCGNARKWIGLPQRMKWSISSTSTSLWKQPIFRKGCWRFINNPVFASRSFIYCYQLRVGEVNEPARKKQWLWRSIYHTWLPFKYQINLVTQIIWSILVAFALVRYKVQCLSLSRIYIYGPRLTLNENLSFSWCIWLSIVWITEQVP